MSSQLGQKVDHIENTKEPSKKQKVASFELGQKVNHIENAKEPISKSKKTKTVLFLSGQKAHKEENTK